jgi:HK97 family phage portal protein
MGLKQWIVEKLSPAQPYISMEQGDNIPSNTGYPVYTRSYNDIEAVRRGVDLIVNGASSFDVSVTEKIQGITPVVGNVRKTRVLSLLNFQPNAFIDITKFRSIIYTDLIMDGNAFIYFDGAFLYNLPAANVEIITDKKTYVKEYIYSGSVHFKPEEIIHISDNSSDSIYRGTSRLKSASATLVTRKKMTQFQDNFFTNGAVPGLILKSPNVLGDKIKQRLIESWQREYNPTKGGKRPLILDGGLDIAKIADINFQQLDFENSITQKDEALLMALGVPSILLYGGNNANISPNLRLFYLETVLPLVRKVTSAFERYFGYNLEPEASKVSALQPDMKEVTAYHVGLVNGGIITPNEAREELRYEPKAGHDDLRIPANIAGSASDPNQGGRPSGDNSKQ